MERRLNESLDNGKMLIFRHIAHLLWADGHVAVSGLGLFSTVNLSANVGDEEVSSPTTSVVFDATAEISSSALVDSVMRQQQISSAQANDLINSDVKSIQGELSRGEKVNIPGVGTIYVDEPTGAIAFASASNFYASSWLKSVAAHPIQTADLVDVVADKEAVERERRREIFARSLRKTASSAAAIAVFALLVFVASQIPLRKDNKVRMASIGVESLTTTADDISVTTTPNTIPTLVLLVNTPDDGTAPAKKRSPKKQGVLSADRYCLVVASFASREDAERYLASNRSADYPLTILDSGGFWRVFAMTAPTINDLSSMASNSNVYEQYPSAWICHR